MNASSWRKAVDLVAQGTQANQQVQVSALQTNTTKFKQDFIGPLFIDTALDKTHYRLKDTTGLHWMACIM